MTQDIAVIGPKMRVDDVKFRNRGSDSAKLDDIKKGLLTLHNLENTATNIHRFQITKDMTGHNRQLIAAVCNEMTH
jgi:hypothetical protein